MAEEPDERLDERLAGAHLVAMLGLVRPDALLEGDGPYQDQSSMLNAVCCSATFTDFLMLGDRLEQTDRPGSLFAGAAPSSRGGTERNPAFGGQAGMSESMNRTDGVDSVHS